MAGLRIFAHGSDSSRHSPRNRQVAAVLSENGLATLLFDLLAPEEAPERTSHRRKVFDIPLLAAPLLARVRAPVLLDVGGDDEEVLELNRLAMARLPSAELAIVPGATHLFEEPGALDAVTKLARGWFLRQLEARKAA